MDKILKPFVVFMTYAVLFSVTYVAAATLVSLTFWINYIDVVQNPFAVFGLLMVILITGAYKLTKSDL